MKLRADVKLIERIDTLKKSEAIIRTERQKLEEKVRHMICKSLIGELGSDGVKG